MSKNLLVCLLLLAGLAGGQTAPPSAPAQPPGAAANSTPALDSKIAPDAPVITINGVCDHPPAEKSGASCKKVITRAEFELMVQIVQPQLTANERRDFAKRYVEALIMEQKAREMGLSQGADANARLKIAREQLLNQLLGMTIGEASVAQTTDKIVEDYYRQNPALYTEADLTRIVVPGIQRLPASTEKLSEDEEIKRDQASEDIMKAEAEKVRARAVAGEDFNKLQAEAYRLAEVDDAPPSTNLGKVRGDSLPPGQISVMGLKTGEISPLLINKNGYFIYKVGEKRVIPLTEVREDIRKTLAEQYRQTELEAIRKSATPSFNETYFGK
jgi:hypothetical protein